MGAHRWQWMPFRPPFPMAGERFLEYTSSCRNKLLTLLFYWIKQNPATTSSANPCRWPPTHQASDWGDSLDQCHRVGKGSADDHGPIHHQGRKRSGGRLRFCGLTKPAGGSKSSRTSFELHGPTLPSCQLGPSPHSSSSTVQQYGKMILLAVFCSQYEIVLFNFMEVSTMQTPPPWGCQR